MELQNVHGLEIHVVNPYDINTSSYVLQVHVCKSNPGFQIQSTFTIPIQVYKSNPGLPIQSMFTKPIHVYQSNQRFQNQSTFTIPIHVYKSNPGSSIQSTKPVDVVEGISCCSAVNFHAQAVQPIGYHTSSLGLILGA